MRQPASLTPVVRRRLLALTTAGLGWAGAAALAGSAALAQIGDCPPDITFCVETRRVILHVSVVDRRDHFVTDLAQAEFMVFEDDKQQSLTFFTQADMPVSIGLVIDNSGSMRDKRRLVNAAALEFVKASNPEDEVFVVNFNEESYIDQDFTSDIDRLQDALQRIDTRGGTALYDATSLSLDHLVKAGNKDYHKRALLIITDGEDTSSRMDLEILVRKLQASDVTIYGIGILSEEERRSAKRAERHLRALTRATGGPAYFPTSLSEVEPLARRVAADIRNQYILEYNRPASTQSGYRRIRINLKGPARSNQVRHRPGYYTD